MLINHLASVRFGVNEELTKDLCDKIDEKVDAYAAGELKYAADAMSLLWEVSKKGKRPVSTATFQSAAAIVRSPPFATLLPLISFDPRLGITSSQPRKLGMREKGIDKIDP